MSISWQRAIVVGASSGIGESLARKLAQAGCQVALVARREQELQRISMSISSSSGGTPKPLTYVHDVNDTDAAELLLQQIAYDLGGLDLLIYSAGVMPMDAENSYNTAADVAAIAVNVSGAVAWCNAAAQRFAKQGAGTIVGISSVAGDRGRRGFPVYSASKAFLDTYLEGIRNKVGRYGVKVVTVKPGPVDTPLVKDLNKNKLPMLITSEQAADHILRGIRRDSVLYVPGRWRLVMWLIRHVPSFLFKRLNV